MRANKIQVGAGKVTLLAENKTTHVEVVRLRSLLGIMIGGPEINDHDGWQTTGREPETVVLAPGEKLFGYSGSGSAVYVMVSKKGA